MSSEIKNLLNNIGTSPKKGLGQNFLINKEKIDRISNEIRSEVYDSVIEIGPGLGSITKKIIDIESKVICIEKDTVLYNYLKKEYQGAANLEIFNIDILKCSINEIGNGKRLYFGNLPYNIGTKIIENFTDTFHSDHITSGIFMLQKEVGEKILSKKGTKLYNGYVVKIQSFYNVKKILDLNESDFWPQPNIKSILIRLENRKKTFFDGFDYKSFTKFLFNSFLVRRKKLSNNLQEYYSKDLVSEKLKELKLDENIRAQDIQVETFVLLYEKLINNKSL